MRDWKSASLALAAICACTSHNSVPLVWGSPWNTTSYSYTLPLLQVLCVLAQRLRMWGWLQGQHSWEPTGALFNKPISILIGPVLAGIFIADVNKGVNNMLMTFPDDDEMGLYLLVRTWKNNRKGSSEVRNTCRKRYSEICLGKNTIKCIWWQHSLKEVVCRASSCRKGMMCATRSRCDSRCHVRCRLAE